ncbi:hypothetical protein [Nocardia sp. NPDC049149]|uniref:hypothetical protein n=1 Tax=Nocardia sp. NPDC049149 TaxID=3364315 RepID=UPI00371D6563
MTDTNQDVIDAIHSTFDRVIADGLKPTSMFGASDEQIDSWAAEQGITATPVAVREVLRLIGFTPGLWHAGSAFGVQVVGAKSKRGAIASLSQIENTMVDPAGMLVLVDHQAYWYCMIDGADLSLPNPPVWALSEQEYARVGWPTTTSWFDSTAPNIQAQRERLEFRREQGRSIDPEWSQYFDID